MDPYVTEYLGHLAVERGASRHTIAAYGRDLSDYVGFLSGRGVEDLTMATRDDVTAFVSVLWDRGLAPSTVERRVAAVKGLHKFLVREGITDNHPTARLPLPKVPERLPDVVSIDDIDRLLGQPFPDAPAGCVTARCSRRCTAAGLRVSELTGLDLSGPRPRGRLVRVFGKGGKERIVPIAGMAAHALDAYLKSRSPLPAPEELASRSRHVGGVPERAGSAYLPAGGVQYRASVRSPGRSQAASAHAATLIRDSPAWREVRICALCRRCSGTPTSPRLRSTRTSTAATFARSTSRRILVRASVDPR